MDCQTKNWGIISNKFSILEELNMPHVSTFMYAEGSMSETTPQNQQRLHVVSPLHIFVPMFVPGTFSFCVVFGILDINTDKDHILRITFSNPNKDEPPLIDTGDMHLPRVNDPNAQELPQEMRGIMTNISFQNVVLRYEGIYESEVFFDGDSLGIFPIQVKGKEKL